MKSKSSLLFKTLLLSTSTRNIFRYTGEIKKKKKIIFSWIGILVLCAMITGYSLAMCIGYGKSGMADSVPVLGALIICLLALVLTFFKTNGYLFNFKEYDMLMALPFEAKTVAACKFLYMYVKSLPWYLCISIATLIGYAIYSKPAIYIYPLWIILSLFVPMIPMLIATFLGFVIAKISSGFRKNNIVQTILSLAFVIFCFSLRYIIEAVAKKGDIKDTLSNISDVTAKAGRIVFPAGWFSNAIVKTGISDMLLLIGTSLLVFALVFGIIGSSYRQINSALKSHVASKNYKMTAQKKRSVVKAVAFKEFKRMTGSTVYMTNIAIGEIMAVLLGIVTLIIGFDRIVAIVTQNAPFDYAIVQPAIPFITYFFIGMMATTACSPSLEGRNYWILQSLPVSKKDIYNGKMLFNLYLTIPFMIVSTFCLCISAKVPIITTVLYLILGVVLCMFSTAWGCVVGIKHMRLDWENEVEVIKQGAAPVIYLFPNMILVMILAGLSIFLGTFIDHNILAVIFMILYLTLAAASYFRVMSLVKKET